MSPSLRPTCKAVPALTLAAIAIAGACSAASAADTCPAPAKYMGTFGANTPYAGLRSCRVEFTESGTFTAPSDVKLGGIFVVGGGGGGSSTGSFVRPGTSDVLDWGGGGAGGQAYIDRAFVFTAGQTYTVTIGGGGAGGSADGSGAAGQNGEPSSFGSVVAAGGGGAPVSGAGGAPGYTKTGDVGDGGAMMAALAPGGGGGGSRGANATQGSYVLGFDLIGGMGAGGTVAEGWGRNPYTYPDGTTRITSYGGSGFGSDRGGNFDAYLTPGYTYVGSRGGNGGDDAPTNPAAPGQDGGINTGSGGGGGGKATGLSRQAAGAGGSGFVGVDYLIAADSSSGGGSGGGSGADSGTLRATKPKVGPAGRVVTVTVTAPSAGTAQLTGSLTPSTTRVVCTARKPFTVAATARMTCVPGPGVQRLRRARAVRVKIVVAFRPAAGGSNQTVTAGIVTLPRLRARTIPVTG